MKILGKYSSKITSIMWKSLSNVTIFNISFAMNISLKLLYKFVICMYLQYAKANLTGCVDTATCHIHFGILY